MNQERKQNNSPLKKTVQKITLTTKTTTKTDKYDLDSGNINDQRFELLKGLPFYNWPDLDSQDNGRATYDKEKLSFNHVIGLPEKDGYSTGYERDRSYGPRTILRLPVEVSILNKIFVRRNII